MDRYVEASAALVGTAQPRCLLWGSHFPALETLPCATVAFREHPSSATCQGREGLVYRTGAHVTVCAEEGGLEEQREGLEGVDLVICTQVLARSAAPERDLEDIAAVLSPKGVLLATFPALERSLTQGGSPRDVDGQTEGGTRPRVEHRFTTSGVEALLEKAGFCNIRVRSAGNSLSTSGYLLGMGGADIPPQDEEGGSDEALRYYAVHASAQTPPC